MYMYTLFRHDQWHNSTNLVDDNKYMYIGTCLQSSFIKICSAATVKKLKMSQQSGVWAAVFVDKWFQKTHTY